MMTNKTLDIKKTKGLKIKKSNINKSRTISLRRIQKNKR